MAQTKIKVLIVDDSVVVTRTLTTWLCTDSAIEVVGTAQNPYIARDQILALNPDVITLDMEMPMMDGLTFLKILTKEHPIPVIVMSSLTRVGSNLEFEAFENGAFAVLQKPNSNTAGACASALIHKIKEAAQYKRTGEYAANPVQTWNENLSTHNFHKQQILLLGASTGGPETLERLLSALPENVPGICVAQHIPPKFSTSLAERLNHACKFEVREAKQNDYLEKSLCLVAPGDYHMILHWDGQRYYVKLNNGPKVWHQRPAVDVLFNSAADCAGKYAVAALLTGMGCDGADGLLKLKNIGAQTFAQDENTSIVFGMPKAAYDIGATKKLVPLHQMAQTLYKALTRSVY